MELDILDDYYGPAMNWRNLRPAVDQDGFQSVEADIRDMEGNSLSDIDAVVHLAARPGVRPSCQHPMLCQQADVDGTQRMLEYVRDRGGVRRVIGFSSPVKGNTDEVPFQENHKVDRPISPSIHRRIDWRRVATHAPAVVDSQNALRDIDGPVRIYPLANPSRGESGVRAISPVSC